MLTLIILFSLSIVLAIAVVVMCWQKIQDKWPAIAIVFGITTILILAGYFTSIGFSVGDVEILNGEVLSKERVHGSYQRTYDCRCRQVCPGTGKNQSCRQECDTCYEDHYTVKWNCQTTVGDYEIDSKDWTSQLVYALPNPDRWTIIKPGDPASRRHTYTNYVQAVPNTLFSPINQTLKDRFASLIPAYPDQVYDFYRNDHFVLAGYSTPDYAQWNHDLGMMLRKLGPQKQVNVIVVLARTADANYEYALRDAWDGANKNDVVLIIGSEQFPKIDFVRVISWTKNELFKVELRDRIQELQTVQREKIISTLQDQIMKNFERRKMAEFKYLESDIDPPDWVIVVLAVLIFGLYAGAFYGIRLNKF